MLSNIQEESISKLYLEYNNTIKPLIALIESRYEIFPLPIFNEIRAFNDHIAQCYQPDSDDQIIAKQTKSANSHIKRMALDCFKYLNVYLYDEYVKKFRKETNSIDLSKINNGEFIIEYRKLFHEAKEYVRNAKKIEMCSFERALAEFQNAFNTYSKLEQLVEDNLKFIYFAKRFSIFKGVIKVLLWLSAAILSGLISLFFTCESVSNFCNNLFK